MNNSSNNTGENSKAYSPKTSQERNAAFKLLEELKRESARQQALREELVRRLSGEYLAQSLSRFKEVPLVRRELSPEEKKVAAQKFGEFMQKSRPLGEPKS